MRASPGSTVAVDRAATAPTGSRLTLRRQATVAGYLFLLPNIVGFLVFSSIPVLVTLVISTLDWDMIRTPTFVGLQNYARLLADGTFKQAAFNTAYFTVVGLLAVRVEGRRRVDAVGEPAGVGVVRRQGGDGPVGGGEGGEQLGEQAGERAEHPD